MNIYTTSHRAACPNGNLMDAYKITIRTSGKILVEDIQRALAETPKQTHQEDLATLLRAKLGAEVTVKGWHHGVKITSIRN